MINDLYASRNWWRSVTHQIRFGTSCERERSRPMYRKLGEWYIRIRLSFRRIDSSHSLHPSWILVKVSSPILFQEDPSLSQQRKASAPVSISLRITGSGAIRSGGYVLNFPHLDISLSHRRRAITIMVLHRCNLWRFERDSYTDRHVNHTSKMLIRHTIQ